MSEITAYASINLSATLDGVAVSGFWEGDNAVEVAPGADVGSLMVGIQGDALFSQSANNSARITLRLMPTSPTHRQLVQKMAAQRAGRMVAFPFDQIDTGNNEGGTADKCFIATAPTDNKGESATVREWVLITGDYKPTVPKSVTV